MKKIAICFSGHLRKIDKTYPNIYENLISPNKADVFLHTWSTTYNPDNLRRDAILYGIDTTNNDINTVKPLNWLIQDLTEVVEKYLDADKLLPIIKNYYDLLEDQIKEKHRFKDAVPLLGMFYGIKQSFDLKKNWEKENNFKYDITVRCRPDIVFAKPVVLSCIEPMNGIYAKCRKTHEERIIHGINDQFAFGPSDLMDIYADTINHLNDEIHLKYNTYWAPEQCFFTWINSQGIKVYPFDTGHRIRRPSGYEPCDEDYGKYNDQ